MLSNALKLEPWDTNGEKDESFPQVPGATIGSWGSTGSPPNSSGRLATTGLCGLECDEPFVSPNRSPNLRQRMILSNRDKESLLEEIIDLKRALSDQAYHLKLHKVHYSAVQLENRKLEKDIEDLEVSGNLEAPRTGGPTRLRAKLQGLRTRLGDLQATCDIQHDELCQLRRDIRVAHTRECEVERDVYAAEIGRLQKVVKRLKALQLKITAENQELGRLRDKAARLKLANQRLESCIIISHKTLERASKEIASFRMKAVDCSSEAKKSAQRIKELQEQAVILEELLEKERIEKGKVEQKLKILAKQRKDWDKAWEEKQKKKLMGEEAYRAAQERKKVKKPKEVRKDKGAHATPYGDTSSDSSSDHGMDAKALKKRKREAFEARKNETLQKYEQRKHDMMKTVQVASKTFVEQQRVHHDKVFAKLGSPRSAGQIPPKDVQKQHDLETGLLQSVDDAALAFIDDVEEIHYGSNVRKPKVEGLSPKAVTEAMAKYARDVAEDAQKRKAAKGGSRPASPSTNSGKSGKAGGSRPGSPSSEASSTKSHSSSEDSSDDTEGSDHTLSSKEKIASHRQDRERGKNGTKLEPEDFEDQRVSFLKKARKASQHFVEQEQGLYSQIQKEIESGLRSPGSVGWFSTTSAITQEDKAKEEAIENIFHEGLEGAADSLLDYIEDVQYGTDKSKVPRLRLKELKAREAAKLARENEQRMHQSEIEERARRKAEMEAAQRWKNKENKVEVMIDDTKLEEDEYSADVKEVKGRLSVEINLKRSADHPYIGSPRSLALEEEKRKEQARLEKQAHDEQERRMVQEARRMEEIRAERQREAQARMEEERVQALKEMEEFRGLTADENRRRQELEAKLASGIPLTAEEEAELKALHARLRGRSGLTLQEEIRLKELEAKIKAGIPLTVREAAELEALKARFRGKSGLTESEEARLKELQEKLAAGIPLTEEETQELHALKGRLRGVSGLTVAEKTRLKELQAKMMSGMPLTDEEEAELRDLKLDMVGKSGLSGREEARLNELEAKLRDGIPLTAREEAELNELRSRARGKSGLTKGQESRLAELEAKLQSGIPLTTEEEEELNALRGQMIRKSGLTGREEDRLKELEAKVNSGIPLTPEEEQELKRLQKKLRIHSQLTQSEDERRKELEAKLAQGLTLTEEEERELKELQAKRWNEWPLGTDEDQRRKELEAKLKSGIPLTPEEEAELLALQMKLKGKFPAAEFGELDMTKSEEMRKRGKLPFIDKEMQGFIKENIRGVLGHLENITEVIVQKQQKLHKHEAGAFATAEAAADVLKASESGSGSGGRSLPVTPRRQASPGGTIGGSKPATPRDRGGGSKPVSPKGGKGHSPGVEKGEHSRLGKKDGHEKEKADT